MQRGPNQATEKTGFNLKTQSNHDEMDNAERIPPGDSASRYGRTNQR